MAQVPASHPLLGAALMYSNFLLNWCPYVEPIQLSLGYLDSISALHGKVQLNPQEAMDLEGTAQRISS